VLFAWLHFPDFLVIGKWAQYGLQWHFFGMWIFVLNGLAYLTYGIATGRFQRKLFPISLRETLPASAFPLHGGDRRVFAGTRDTGAFGAAKPGRHGHRRSARAIKK
jgi:hypothetical protein